MSGLSISIPLVSAPKNFTQVTSLLAASPTISISSNSLPISISTPIPDSITKAVNSVFGPVAFVSDVTKNALNSANLVSLISPSGVSTVLPNVSISLPASAGSLLSSVSAGASSISSGLGAVSADINAGAAEVQSQINAGAAEVQSQINAGAAEVQSQINAGSAAIQSDLNKGSSAVKSGIDGIVSGVKKEIFATLPIAAIQSKIASFKIPSLGLPSFGLPGLALPLVKIPLIDLHLPNPFLGLPVLPSLPKIPSLPAIPSITGLIAASIPTGVSSAISQGTQLIGLAKSVSGQTLSSAASQIIGTEINQTIASSLSILEKPSNLKVGISITSAPTASISFG